MTVKIDTTGIKLLPISSIVIPERKRPLRDVTQLSQSIQDLGLLNPITVTSDNRLIAGLHRLTACKKLGWTEIKCNVVELDDLHAELAEIDENLVRNELTQFEQSVHLMRRKEIYEALYPEVRHGATGGTNKGKERSEVAKMATSVNRFTADAASKTGKGERTISRQVQIGENLESFADDIFEIGIEDSQKDLSALASFAQKEGTEAAAEVIEIAKEHISASGTSANGKKITDGKKSIRNAVREYRRKKEAEKANKIEALPESIQLHHGDFIEALSYLEDGSIDLIVTDPPYPHEYIECWSKLSAFASRVLKPGGFCIAYSGHMHLPEVMQRLGENLDYYWTFCLMQTGFSKFLTPRNLYVLWKPILVYQKGFSLYKPEKDPVADVIDGSGKAKFSHVWQQGEDELNGLIEYFSNVGDAVCDPFTGSGTTLLKAAKMKRIAIGAEIEKDHYLQAKKRISDGLQ